MSARDTWRVGDLIEWNAEHPVATAEVTRVEPSLRARTVSGHDFANPPGEDFSPFPGYWDLLSRATPATQGEKGAAFKVGDRVRGRITDRLGRVRRARIGAILVDWDEGTACETTESGLEKLVATVPDEQNPAPVANPPSPDARPVLGKCCKTGREIYAGDTIRAPAADLPPFVARSSDKHYIAGEGLIHRDRRSWYADECSLVGVDPTDLAATPEPAKEYVVTAIRNGPLAPPISPFASLPAFTESIRAALADYPRVTFVADVDGRARRPYARLYCEGVRDKVVHDAGEVPQVIRYWRDEIGERAMKGSK